MQYASTQYFTSLDFNEVFRKVPLVEEQCQYFAFAFEGVPHEFTVVPYGTNDSMQGFLAASRKVLEECQDFVSYSKSDKEHRGHIKIIVDKIY